MSGFVFLPTAAVGIIGGLGLGMLVGDSNGDTGRVVFRSVITAIALRALALYFGTYAAIGAGLTIAFVAAALTGARVIASDHHGVCSYLTGAFLFGGALGYVAGAIL